MANVYFYNYCSQVETGMNLKFQTSKLSAQQYGTFVPTCSPPIQNKIQYYPAGPEASHYIPCRALKSYYVSKTKYISL